MASMHDNEFHIDAALVRRLLADQFPRWSHLPIKPVPSAGTDNALFRLGDEMVIRMPRIHWAVGQPAKEQRWLPRLAPLLPLAIPAPLALGAPGEGYPWQWSVHGWLSGENATLDRLADERQAAIDLARFVVALQRIDASGGPAPDRWNAHRGAPLLTRDSRTREAIDSLQGKIDATAATALWDEALNAAAWQQRPVWVHGDFQSGNLLAVDGRLSAVIDFGCMAVGDPACDLMAAWSYLSERSRALFREAIDADEATWRRARGWALSVSVIALPYYEQSNPVLAGIARRTLQQVFSDLA